VGGVRAKPGRAQVLASGHFSTDCWRSGTSEGLQADDVFFVRPSQQHDLRDIDQGRPVCLVGFAPVQPAEFAIVRISQMDLRCRWA
jgi:phage tail sheath protein FI